MSSPLCGSRGSLLKKRRDPNPPETGPAEGRSKARPSDSKSLKVENARTSTACSRAIRRTSSGSGSTWRRLASVTCCVSYWREPTRKGIVRSVFSSRVTASSCAPGLSARGRPTTACQASPTRATSTRWPSNITWGAGPGARPTQTIAIPPGTGAGKGKSTWDAGAEGASASPGTSTTRMQRRRMVSLRPILPRFPAPAPRLLREGLCQRSPGVENGRSPPRPAYTDPYVGGIIGPSGPPSPRHAGSLEVRPLSRRKENDIERFGGEFLQHLDRDGVLQVRRKAQGVRQGEEDLRREPARHPVSPDAQPHVPPARRRSRHFRKG